LPHRCRHRELLLRWLLLLNLLLLNLLLLGDEKLCRTAQFAEHLERQAMAALLRQQSTAGSCASVPPAAQLEDCSCKGRSLPGGRGGGHGTSGSRLEACSLSLSRWFKSATSLLQGQATSSK
jgi:hypothetical protein